MRFFGFFVLLVAVFAPSLAIFRSPSRGMTSIDENSGDVIWVPIPQDGLLGNGGRRKCLFCRGVRK
ncbi:Neuropeptide-Like Protein [Caenorhabditis elegans]|uniref:Neuropeptide-Like Protein n=1 Tax=Caenorhabditis elegans TaxID=6239 RepID=A6ZJ72_CAEEL|nr:Neuropeptide-Like Protein [Caenorhabditis elegans]CAO78747.1 Neuropeptide-Like Protein [Caenorhabditis elegans]|eukprot:NP_001076746.1 Uncharacterized protein CELE_F53F4.17 [Caenorhabditis elegans]